MTELPWLYAALSAYGLAMLFAFIGVASNQGVTLIRRPYDQLVLTMLVAGVVLLVVTLTVRWLRLDHGPFVNLFELLISQLFSLGIIFAILYWRIPAIRPSAVVALPLLWVLGGWVLMMEPRDSVMPPTYHHNWLWAHIGFGKIFLSFCLVGTSLAGVLLLRPYAICKQWFQMMPDNNILDQLAWRLMLVAFMFHTLMLVSGAVWAQDAWGRYWAWDALETSSFLNWLALGVALHVRTTYTMRHRVGAWVIIGIFMFAFFTYFGTPFYSMAAHKGVI